MTHHNETIDIHVHLLDEPGLDAEFLRFAQQSNMPFAISCLGTNNNMLVDPTPEQCRAGNDLVIDLMHRVPTAIGFCYLNPLHGPVAIEEMRRCVSEHGMSGIKLWIACRCSDLHVFPIVEEAIRLGVPVLQHSWFRQGDRPFPGESTPDDVAELARRYPDLKLIMAHMGFMWKCGVDVVADCPNVMVDTSGTDPERGMVEYAVERLGADRVLYGSDAPGRDVLCQIGKVMAARLSAEDLEKVLSRNARRILERTSKP